MSQEKSSRKRRVGVDHAEEKAWVGFYRRVSDPAIAAEILHELQSDPEMKRAHLALYLRCKESLRAQKARLARNKRIGQFVRMVCVRVFVSPARVAQRLIGHSRDIAIECLPDATAEPAARQVRKLTAEAEFAQEQSAFANAPASALPKGHDRSAIAKSA